jgi:hypothetical protein
MSPALVPLTAERYAAAKATVEAQGKVLTSDQLDKWRQFYEGRFPAGTAIDPPWAQVVLDAGGQTATWLTILPVMNAALRKNNVFPDGDPVGACVYNVNGSAVCQVMTSLQCQALNGVFSAGQSCPS